MSSWAAVKAAAPSIESADPAVAARGFGRQLNPHPKLHVNISTGQLEYTRAWMVKRSEADDALAVISGQPENVSIFGNIVVRFVPLICPIYSYMIAEDITATDQGWDWEGGTNRESHVLIEVRFVKPLYPMPPSTNPYVMMVKQPSGRQLPSPAIAWRTADGFNPFVDPGLEVPGSDLRLTMFHVPDPFDIAYLNTYGRYTNQAAWINHPIETARYNVGSAVPVPRMGSLNANTVTLNFGITSPDIPWNYYPQAADGVPSLMTGDGTITGIRRFPLANFNTLFAF